MENDLGDAARLIATLQNQAHLGKQSEKEAEKNHEKLLKGKKAQEKGSHQKALADSPIFEEMDWHKRIVPENADYYLIKMLDIGYH
jgi:hypothetical protein